MAPSRRKSKAAAKAAAQRQWKVGDLVLAKVKGFPAWPATVSEPTAWGYKSDWKKVLVYFFGTQQIAFCNPADVEEFTEEKKEALLVKRPGRSADFVRAVQEIVDSFDKLKELNRLTLINSGEVSREDTSEVNNVKDSTISCHSNLASDLSNGKGEKIPSHEDVVKATKVDALPGTCNDNELFDNVSVPDKPISKIGSTRRTRTSQLQRKVPGQRSRNSVRSDTSRIQNDTGAAANDCDDGVTNKSFVGSLRRNKQNKQSDDALIRNTKEAAIGSNGIVDDFNSEGAMNDSDTVSNNKPNVMESIDKRKPTESPTGFCAEEVPLRKGLDFPTETVILRKKRKSGRKRITGNVLCYPVQPDQDVEKDAELNKEIDPHSKDDGDEHLPLVKRARVRMGKSSLEQQLEVSTEEEKLMDAVLSDEPAQLDATLDSADENCLEKHSSIVEPIMNQSPSDSSVHVSEGKPDGWKRRNTQSFSCSYDGEAALPPSKRLHRALEAMSANAAEEGQQTCKEPSCMQEAIDGCDVGLSNCNSRVVSENVVSENEQDHLNMQHSSDCQNISSNDYDDNCVSKILQASQRNVKAVDVIVPDLLDDNTDSLKLDSESNTIEAPASVCDQGYEVCYDVRGTSNAVNGVSSLLKLPDISNAEESLGQGPHMLNHLPAEDEVKAENLEALCIVDRDNVVMDGCHHILQHYECQDGILSDKFNKDIELSGHVQGINDKDHMLKNEIAAVAYGDGTPSMQKGSESEISEPMEKLKPTEGCELNRALQNQDSSKVEKLPDSSKEEKLEEKLDLSKEEKLPDPLKEEKLLDSSLEKIITDVENVTGPVASSSVFEVAASPQKCQQTSVSAEELHVQAVASNPSAGLNIISRRTPPSSFTNKSDFSELSKHGEQSVRDAKLCCEQHSVNTDEHGKSHDGLPSVVGSIAKSSSDSELKVALASLEATLESLTRTKDSIGRATRIALVCAKLGSASEVVDILARTLERESNLYKRIDLFFLVDSIAQCSRGLKGSVGEAYISAIQSSLPRLLSAAAPGGYTARENQRQCLKVLKLWVERRILSESIVKQHIRDLDSYNTSSSGAYSRRMSRTERSFDDPIREMEGMLVDEYGSNASFQLPGFSMPRMVKIEDYDGSDSDEGSFEAVTPEHETSSPLKEDATSLRTSEKHRHILEEVDGELEMEDVAPSCEAETRRTSISSTCALDVALSSHPCDHSLPPFAPLPCGMPPLPTSPPPLPPPPPPPPPPQALPPLPPLPPPPPPPPPHMSHPLTMSHVAVDSQNLLHRHNLQEAIPLPPPPPPPPPRITSQMQMNDASNSCSYSPYPMSHPSVRPSNDPRTTDNYQHNPYHLRPPHPAPSNQFSYFQGEQRPRPPPSEGPPYFDQPRYQHSMEGGGCYYGEHDNRRSRGPEHSDSWRYRPYPEKSRGYTGPPSHSDHPPRELPRLHSNGWSHRTRPMHHRNHGTNSHFDEGPAPVPIRAPSYWPPR